MPMATFISDLKHGARILVKHPAVYAAAFLTLAVGIASATTMFSVVNAVLLEPLPYANADRLALVWDRAGDSGRDIWLSPPEFADLRDTSEAFAEAAALTDRRYTLSGRAEPEEMQAAAVSPNLFGMVGARALAGRALQPGDDAHGSGFVAVISEPVAERLFSSAAAAVGQALTLDGQAWTVVGVLPRSFSIWPPSAVFPRRVDVWVPIDDELYTSAGRNQNFLHALVRMKDGVSVARASADLARVAANIERAHADFYANQRWRMTLVGLQEHLVGGVRPAVLILFGAVALLLAAVGIYGVMAFAVSERTPEIGVRMALGADPASVLRLIVGDGAWMTAGGVVAGVALAIVVARALRTMLFGVDPWDPAVFVGVTLLLAAVALFASYLPARRAARLDPTVALRTARP
jgi:ABC-type antimicrobial peptide transport system permease subunit